MEREFWGAHRQDSIEGGEPLTASRHLHVKQGYRRTVGSEKGFASMRASSRGAIGPALEALFRSPEDVETAARQFRRCYRPAPSSMPPFSSQAIR